MNERLPQAKDGVVDEPIAIVGIGMRLPGGIETPDGLVRFLDAHGDGVREVPKDRWSLERFYSEDPDAPGRMYVKHAAFLEHDIFSMDPTPFNMSPRECALLDPQQRLLLEAAWDALEDAGIPITKLRGSNTGVYVGNFMLDARDIVSMPATVRSLGSQAATSVSSTVLSNRLSYTFDWHGPSFSVDTACSSSLVTIHLACRDLLSGACDLALAGGVSVMLSPVSTIVMCKGGFLARDGRSKAFDASADGYGRGEGVALLALRRLSDAVANGDRIYAAILGTGVNQDGRTNGMPQPNEVAQVALARSIVAKTRINPLRLGYVEAHGTGTRAGDTIETSALGQVYAGALRPSPLAIGSIKTNVGHMEAAAGAVGVIKAALSLYHRRLFPLRALATPNPEIPFHDLRLRVPVESEAWPEDADLTAAVNSFGYGGTNAHAVLCATSFVDSSRVAVARSITVAAEGAQAVAAPNTEGAHAPSGVMRSSQHLEGFKPLLKARTAGGSRLKYVPISACDASALKARAAHMESLLKAPGAAPLESLASTLAHHRAHLQERAVVLSLSQGDYAGVSAAASGTEHERLVRGRADGARLCCVYTGMGPQWWGMGRELFETEPVFRLHAESVDAIFSKASGWSILDEFFRVEVASRMGRNSVAQPANFLLQVALTELFRHYGVRFDGYLGHSVGEVTAAWAAGCLTLEAATQIAFHRSDLQQNAAGQGTMLATDLPLDEAEGMAQELKGISVAAINGSRSTVLAGDRTTLEVVERSLSSRGGFARFINVEVAYHSAQMDPLEGGFRSRLDWISPSAPASPLFSTAYGIPITDASHDADYWWKNARMPVLLQPALNSAISQGFDTFLEVGPHPVLASAIVAAGREASTSVKVLAALNRKEHQATSYAKGLASVHCAGFDVDWEKLAPRRSFVALPAYPFQRARYWEEQASAADHRLGRSGSHPLLDQRLDTATPTWGTELDASRFPWLTDHRVAGACVFPGAAYLEIGLAVSAELFGGSEHVLEDVEFSRALTLLEREAGQIRVTYQDEVVSISSKLDDSWQRNATLRLTGRSPYRTPESFEPALVNGHLHELDVATLYADLYSKGLAYSGDFRGLRRVWVDPTRPGWVAAEVQAKGAGDYLVFPAFMDAAFQAVVCSMLTAAASPLVPIRARTVRCFRRATERGLVVVERSSNIHEQAFDIKLYTPEGEPIAQVDGLVVEVLPVGPQRGSSIAHWLHRKKWVEREPVTQLHAVESLGVVASDPEVADWLCGVLAAAGQPSVRTTSDSPSPAHIAFVSGRGEETTDVAELVCLTRWVQASSGLQGRRLTVITFGAHSVVGERTRPMSGAVCGLARVIMTEHPEFQAQILDLPLGGHILPSLLKESILDRGEEECALRDDKRLGLRIVRGTHADTIHRATRRVATRTERAELVCEVPGSADSLVFTPRYVTQPLRGDEIEVEVEYASINFKDVMKVAGSLNPLATWRTYLGSELGTDASGRVLAVGKDVTRIRPGQRVAMAARCAFSTKIRLPEAYAVPIPDSMSGPTAASLLVNATAWHALVEKARVVAGESVLIHSCASNVGLASIQLAQRLGAKVFGTAGTPEKRAYLRQLGVECVYDSKTLNYVGEIQRDTCGRGVDVVLNSLAGPHLRPSVGLLAPGGRFVELGKQDLVNNTQLPLRGFNAALSFHAVDIDRMTFEVRSFLRPLFEAACNGFEDGIFSPLPTQVFAANNVAQAFRSAAHEQRIGKVVIDFRGGISEVAPAASRSLFQSDATYLVVGGLNGFGLVFAAWMLKNGAGNLVLASRTGDVHSDDRPKLLQMNNGHNVSCRALDVTDEDAVARLISEIDQDSSPLRGVFHAAAVMRDLPLGALDEMAIEAVFEPKARGAWNLHRACAGRTLDYFVLFSSVSAWVGNSRQGSYAAANAYMDSLCAVRTAASQPCISVAWGAIGEAGMLARDPATATYLERLGIRPMNPELALDVLKGALKSGQSDFGIMDFDWDRWVGSFPQTRWVRLEEVSGGQDGANSRSEQIAAALAPLSEEQRADAVVQGLCVALAPIFKQAPTTLDTATPLRDLGLDSFLTLEVQAAVDREFSIELSTMEVLAGRSIRALATLILTRLMSRRIDGLVKDAGAGAAYLPPADLRGYFLERICVQPPYFALEAFTLASGKVRATAVPAPLAPGSPACFHFAEAARHMAIVGSCAARLALPEREGRFYFPIHEATLMEWAGKELPAQVVVRSWNATYDKPASKAHAETELLDAAGELLCRMNVSYHVISEDEFQTLFASKAQSMQQQAHVDPYWGYESLQAVQVEDRQVNAVRGTVTSDQCLGHFDGFPAFPVSIMLRDVFAAMDAGIREWSGEDVDWGVTAGSCTCERFAFVGENVTLVSIRPESGSTGVWRTQVLSQGETVATFELAVTTRATLRASGIAQAGATRTSGPLGLPSTAQTKR